MKLKFIMFAKLATTDSETNLISLIHILEQFNFPAFPAVIPPFTVVTMLEREPNEPQKEALQVRFTLDDKRLVDFPFSVDFQSARRHRFSAEIRGLTVSQPGVLKAALRSNNKTLGAWSIEVIETGQGPQLTPISQQAPTAPKPKAKKAKKKSSRKLRAATADTPKARKGGKKSPRKPRSS